MTAPAPAPPRPRQRFQTDPPPTPELPRGASFSVYELPCNPCGGCGADIRHLDGCRVIVYKDIRGAPLAAGLLCPNC